MPIVTSTFLIDEHSQVNGARYVTETHTASTGKVIEVMYRTKDAERCEAVMLARVPQINQQLHDSETEECVQRILAGENMMTMTFVDTTRQDVSRSLFRTVAADPNPKNVLVISPLMDVLYQLHPTEQEQAAFLGVPLETIREANNRFAALAGVATILNADEAVEVE
jgi:hypothetical protein